MDVALTRRDQVSVTNPDEGDLFVDEAGQFVVLEDESPEAEAQAIGIGLSTTVGEWFLDLTAGVPYRTKILGIKGVTDPQIATVIRAEIARRGSVDMGSLRVRVTRDADRAVTVEWDGSLTSGESVSGVATSGE